MPLHKTLFFFLCAFVAFDAFAQKPAGNSDAASAMPSTTAVDFSKVVVPIDSIRVRPKLGVSLTGTITPRISQGFSFGTGFCLDAACRFIVTNYHVGKLVPARKIRHEKIVNRYFATGADDKEATLNFLSGDPLPYAAKRDLALLELRWPIKGYHGLKFSIDDLEPRQEVDIYSFPYEFNPFRSLKHVTARFNAPTTTGLLAFDCDPAADKQIHVAGGSSGGIVVDRKTQRIVGILSEVNGTIALAVPVKTLVDFVSKVQPFVAVKTFPAFKNPGFLSVDIYPRFEPQADFNSEFKPSHSGVLEHRVAEPYDVALLRQKAQRLADNMRNFIAVQSFEWGSGDREPQYRTQYEVRVIDGKQRYRDYPNGKRELRRIPFPLIPDWALGSDEWSAEANMVGTEFGLKIRRAADTDFNGRKVRVFQYTASVEDDVCRFQPLDNYIFFNVGSPFPVGCYGEVWTDENTDIIRISENFDLSKKLKKYKKWDEYRTVLTYDWIKIDSEPTRLLPMTIFVEGLNEKKLFWCRGTFTNYHLFASHSKLLVSQTMSVPPDPK